MKWRQYWPETLVVLLSVALESTQWTRTTAASAQAAVNLKGWTPQRKLDAREKTRELWYHGFDNYMNYAFPMDELRPLTCSGLGPDWFHPENIAVNDVAGNFSLTLIDVLDTFIVLDDRPGFEIAVRNVIRSVSFDVDTKPQVFETTIRVLGGLISAHTFASQRGGAFQLPWYRDELLSLATDLGNRLLPAFNTPTGLPYARINLRRGVEKGETTETCTAGAGSLILEFGTLSRLTGDPRYEKAARKAFFAIWNRRTTLNLVGNKINIRTGDWQAPEFSSTGAGIDSFFEYALKWYVLSGDEEFLDVWHESYDAVMRFSRDSDGFWYRKVNIRSGDPAFWTIDSLSAFWPGLQVLAGDTQNAVRSHMAYWNVWRQHSAIPEVWDVNFRETTSWQYPLRPEFVESTWYLYRATRDPFYLDVGERILVDLVKRAKVPCGLSGIKDLRNNDRDDRMESFVLSETLKYLYLLFDEENPLHSDDSNYVFTTEGHILNLGQEHIKTKPSTHQTLTENYQCPTYQPVVVAFDNQERRTGLVQGIRSRSDFDYARSLVFLFAQPVDVNLWSPSGWCEKPKDDPHSYNFVMSGNDLHVPEDLSPSLLKLSTIPEGFLVHNVTGIRAHFVKRLDGRGYDIAKIGHYKVRKGQTVFVNDTALARTLDSGKGTDNTSLLIRPELEIVLHLNLDTSHPGLPLLEPDAPFKEPIELLVTAFTSTFGADPASSDPTIRFGRGRGQQIARDLSNPLGCSPFEQQHKDAILLVERGACTFLQKLVNARDAGAAGVITLSQTEGPINPSTEPGEFKAAGDISGVSLVVVVGADGDLVREMVSISEETNAGPISVTVAPRPQLPEAKTDPPPTETVQEVSEKLLYLNGHPVQNTRLLV